MRIENYLGVMTGMEWKQRDPDNIHSSEGLENDAGHRIDLEIISFKKEFTLVNIFVEPELRGQEYGRRMIYFMKNYADDFEKTFRVEDIRNYDFFEQFEFLELTSVNEEEDIYHGVYVPPVYIPKKDR